MTRWFDKTDATHLLFIDADMGFPAELVLDMVDFGRPVVGVVYPKRQIDLERVAELSAAGEPAKRAIARAHNFIVRKKRGLSIASPHTGFMQVDGCGAGVLLIARTAIETMLKKTPDLSDPTARANSPLAANLDRLIRAFEPLRVNGALLSEDFSFCHRWNACGGEVWVNTAHEIEHIGLHRFKGRYSDLGPQLTVGTAADPGFRTGNAAQAARHPARQGRDRAEPEVARRPASEVPGRAWTQNRENNPMQSRSEPVDGPAPRLQHSPKKIRRREAGGFLVSVGNGQEAASCMASCACSCMIAIAAGIGPASATGASPPCGCCGGAAPAATVSSALRSISPPP